MYKVMLIDDEKSLHMAIEKLLTKSGYEYCGATDAESGLEMLATEKPDLLLLDVMLPGMNGFDLCTRIRAEGRRIPIIFLSAKNDIVDKSIGFRAGGDDYVTKPFSMPVLLEKIRVILRRSGEAAESRLHYRDLVVDLDTREAALDGRPLDLTAREFELLRTFLAAPGRVFTREMLLSRLWGYDFFGDERVVDSHIKNLRHKLGRDYIETVRGVGYRAAKETR